MRPAGDKTAPNCPAPSTYIVRFMFGFELKQLRLVFVSARRAKHIPGLGLSQWFLLGIRVGGWQTIAVPRSPGS